MNDNYIRCTNCSRVSIRIDRDGNYHCTQCVLKWEYFPSSFKTCKDPEAICPCCKRVNHVHRNMGVVDFQGVKFLGCSFCRKRFNKDYFLEFLRKMSPPNMSSKKCYNCNNSDLSRKFYKEYYVVTCNSCASPSTSWIEIPYFVKDKQHLFCKCPNCGDENEVSDKSAFNNGFKLHTLMRCDTCYITTKVKWVGEHNGFCPKCDSGYPIYKSPISEIFDCLKCNHRWGGKEVVEEKPSIFKKLANKIGKIQSLVSDVPAVLTRNDSLFESSNSFSSGYNYRYNYRRNLIFLML